MTREQKLALIVGFALVLVVGVLVSDHLSVAQRQVAGDDAILADSLEPEAESPGLGRDVSGLAIAASARGDQAKPLDESYFTGEPPVRVADTASGNSLESRAQHAMDMISDGASRFGALLRDGANENPPAMQTEFVTPSIRDDNVPAPEIKPVTRTSRDLGSGPRQVTTTSSSGASGASAKANYPVHVVKAGDSLWSIAEHYYSDGGLYTKLAAFNTGRTGPDGTLRVGASLLIPPREVLTGEKVASSEPARRTEASRGGSGGAPAKGAPAGKGTAYTVKSGDTLSEISQTTLGTSKRWREILDLNKDVLEDAESLRVGMTLKIPAR